MLSTTNAVYICGSIGLLLNLCLLVAVIVQQGHLSHKVDGLTSCPSGGGGGAENAVNEDFVHSIRNMELLMTAEQKLANCEQTQRMGLPSGVTTIFPAPGFSKRVRCDQETKGGGWTVWVHRKRQPHQLDFQSKTSAQREQGFGDPSGEYFAGLRTIRELTREEDHQLLIYFANTANKSGYFYFGNASVAGPPAYQLSVGNLAANSTSTARALGLPMKEVPTCLASASDRCTVVLNPSDTEIMNEPIFSVKKLMFRMMYGQWTDLLETVGTITILLKPQPRSA